MNLRHAAALDDPRTKRPFGVWVILLLYIVAAVSALLGFALLFTGKVELNPAEKAYFANLSIFDHASTVVLGAINMTAAILLFRLRKAAVLFFCIGFVLNLVLTVRAVFGSNWTEAMGGSVNPFWALLAAFAIVLYAMRLAHRGILH
jgi:hypothetical protein